MNFLDDNERARLRIQHKKERDRRICDRIKAVLLYDKGWSFQEIAEALLLSDEAIRNHVDDYINSNKLLPENGGSVESLSEKQSRQLEIHLQEHIYLYVKDIVAYVQIAFKVMYTVHGMRSWLQRHGFSYKKPAVVPGKANEQRQKEWIVEYEKLRATLPADATISFFQKIEKAYPDKNKIHVFCDNARYYKNKQVQGYLENSKIALHFLPLYSPNLNPIERLWKWMKERVIYNAYYPEFDEFKSAILGFLSLISSMTFDSELGQCFRSRIRDKFRPIGAPTANF